jgi:glycosyltransferase involved in cell wall biosynthesis
MRVLQLGPYPPPHGGVQTNLVAIRHYLLRRRIPCAVLNLTRHRSARDEEVYHPASALEVLKLLWRLRSDIIHVHIGGNVSPRLLAMSFICSLLPRRKLVLTLHSGGYPSSEHGRNARPRSWRGLVFRRFDKIICVNDEMVEMFRRFGVRPERLHLICPHAFFANIEDVALPAPMRDFFARHRPLLLTVSGLEREYDLPLQIEALAKLRERFPGAGLVIIGGGSLEDDLRRLIAGKPYSGDILLCGDIPHEQALRAMAESDLFLRTTLYDGDAISVREAMHLGVPVIATDNGMRPAGVRLIPKSDEAALVAAVEESLTKQARRRVEEDARHAREVDESEAQRNVEAVFELYRELVGGGKGGSL